MDAASDNHAATTKYICIHGHFYQPPRENPWLGEVEREGTAAPNHDWTERVADECYRPNAAARIVDSKNRILYLVNNYRRLSFNVGPTLFRWIERHSPWLYEQILAADRESCAAFDGHGNAIAQAYNHMILPLADRRDQLTQVRWGVRDFQWRFGRPPEGMWLPETAVDLPTLRVLEECGVRFTVLSPHQAARFREEGEERWREAPNGSIPVGRPYWIDLGDDRRLAVFFYDGAISRGIAFERLLEHSGRLLDAIDRAHEWHCTTGQPCLVHTATDGESYGHHFKFGDMALAHAFRELERDDDTEIINYAAFLERFPPTAWAEIHEETAWSCSHGLGRWSDDCGCNAGRIPGGHQKWRGPLRAALDDLRDALREHFEGAMAPLCRDPWACRDDYVEVMLDRGWASDFLERHARQSLDEASRTRFFTLLEMQRATQAMYTSCGWFFDDIADLEGVLILRWAARAIELAERSGLDDGLEARFVEGLANAPSNREAVGDGAEVYRREVLPQRFGSERVVANYAIHTLVEDTENPRRFRCFNVEPLNVDPLGSNPLPCVAGRVEVTDRRTRERARHLYAVLHFGGLDFRCSVRSDDTRVDYADFLAPLRAAVEAQSTVEMMRYLDQTFGPVSYSLRDAFPDFRRLVALRISREPLRVYTDLQQHLFQTYRPLLRSLRQWDVELPADMRAVISRVLSEQLNDLVGELLSESATMGDVEEDNGFSWRVLMGRLNALKRERDDWDVDLYTGWAERRLGGALVEVMRLLTRQGMPWASHQLRRLVEACQVLEIEPRRWDLQTDYFHLVERARESQRLKRLVLASPDLIDRLDTFLGCRFGRRFMDELESGRSGGSDEPEANP